MWEAVAEDLIKKGVNIYMNKKIVELELLNEKISCVNSITIEDSIGKTHKKEYDFVISTMPIRDLVKGLRGKNLNKLFPEKIRKIALNLPYRDFITVGLLLNSLKDPSGKVIDDTWIYVQEPDVKVGRLQIFNNWSISW